MSAQKSELWIDFDQVKTRFADPFAMISKEDFSTQAGSIFQQALSLHREKNLESAGKIYRAIIAQNPRHFDSLHMLGVLCGQKKNFAEALNYLHLGLKLQPNNPSIHYNLGNVLKEAGRFEDAIKAFSRALELKPDFAAALMGRGRIFKTIQRNLEAVLDFSKAKYLSPQNDDIRVEFAEFVIFLKQSSDEQQEIELALKFRPESPSLQYSLASTWINLKRFAEAEKVIEKALLLDPNSHEIIFLRAKLYFKLNKLKPAQNDLEKAINLGALKFEYHAFLAHLLVLDKRPDLALKQVCEFLHSSPNHIQALTLKCRILQILNNQSESLATAQEILKIDSNCAFAHKIQADAFRNGAQLLKALNTYDTALRIQPGLLEAYYGRAIVLQAFKRYDEALISYEIASIIEPTPRRLLGRAILCRMLICDWRNLNSLKNTLVNQIESGLHATTPFAALSVIHSPTTLLKCNRLYITDIAPSLKKPNPYRKNTKRKKNRVGYFSSDFRNHPVSQLIVGLLENHDKSRFEVIGVDICPAPADESTERIKAALDEFVAVGFLSPQDTISRSQALNLDIAIDLNGLTFGGKNYIFSNRVAPIQVNYLGFPGTSGASYYDYLIGDRIIIPEEHFPFYTEKIAYLPHTYLPNDRKKEISPMIPTRKEAGLPNEGFVFCCFNNSYKISPEIFKVWMRILSAVNGSVLWLSEMNASAIRNLSREASMAGVNPSRLVFAPRMQRLADHLARHRLADLFLDTLQYNAHTTASDSLWAGVPILTCLGDSFAGRVAASLLHAIEMPELIAPTLQDYERSAISIASNPSLLIEIKDKLRKNRLTTPLFNSKLFAQNMETLLTKMWARHQKGLQSSHLSL